jgi:SAM-dependent methyltransferase
MIQSPPFSNLARVYDAIFDDVEYDDWCAFTLETIQALGWRHFGAGTSVLDLACGTGSSTLPYSERGFEIVGVDMSADMLEVAREKLPGVEFIQQNFLELNLESRFDLIICVFDSLNNLLESSDLEQTFARVLSHLKPGGVFAFDCNTPLGVAELWDDDRFEGEIVRDEGSARFLWTHRTLESGLGEVTARCWIMDAHGKLEQEFEEVHLERGYDRAELESMLKRVGLTDLHFCEYPDGAEVNDTSPRLWGFVRATN